MKRKIRLLLSLMLVMALAFTFAGCGEKKEEAVDNSPKDYITKAQYDALSESTWGTMTPEEMDAFFGVKGVVDQERSAEWGEGFQVIDWYGKDGVGTLTVLFKQGEDGKWTPSSMSPTSDLK